MEQAVPAAVRARALRGLAWLVTCSIRLAPRRYARAWRCGGGGQRGGNRLDAVSARRKLYASDPTQATRLLEESLALFETQGNARGVAFVLNRLGTIAYDHGNQLLAAERLEASLALARELGDKGAMAETLHNLVGIALVQGDYAQARTLEQTSLALFRELGNRLREPWGLKTLSYIALQQGEIAQARRYLCVESLTISQEMELHRALVYGVVGLAGVAARGSSRLRGRRGCWVRPRHLPGADQVPVPRREPALFFDAYREAARAELEERALAAAWAEGRAMTLEQAIADALDEDPMAAAPARVPSTVGATDRASMDGRHLERCWAARA